MGVTGCTAPLYGPIKSILNLTPLQIGNEGLRIDIAAACETGPSFTYCLVILRNPTVTNLDLIKWDR